jgi:hypothetical protein
MALLTIRPNGDSGTQELTPYPSSNHFENVDEVSEETADFNEWADTSWKYDRYTLQDHTTETGTITNVTVRVRVKKLLDMLSDGYIKLGVKIGSTDYGLTQQTPTTSDATYLQSFDKYPVDDSDWTWARVDALIAVLGLHGGDWPRCYQLQVDVTHITASPQTIVPSSISQPISYGSPKLILTIKPSSIVQAIAYGTPIVLMGALIIQPSSIVQSILVGTPTMRYPQTISPSSIIVTIAYGTPSVGTYGILRPSSIVQQISIGSPTLYKYVWHVILDGQYNIESPEVNRAYVIGQDAYGNPVYGTATDATEGALVGERLDFQQELAIPLTAQAAEVAAAILSKMRITTKKGLILIPPNCGQELFDVVQISDAGANQAAVSFRVVGIRFEYNPKQARYEHRLILGAP